MRISWLKLSHGSNEKSLLSERSPNAPTACHSFFGRSYSSTIFFRNLLIYCWHLWRSFLPLKWQMLTFPVPPTYLPPLVYLRSLGMPSKRCRHQVSFLKYIQHIFFLFLFKDRKFPVLQCGAKIGNFGPNRG